MFGLLESLFWQRATLCWVERKDKVREQNRRECSTTEQWVKGPTMEFRRDSKLWHWEYLKTSGSTLLTGVNCSLPPCTMLYDILLTIACYFLWTILHSTPWTMSHWRVQGWCMRRQSHPWTLIWLVLRNVSRLILTKSLCATTARFFRDS